MQFSNPNKAVRKPGKGRVVLVLLCGLIFLSGFFSGCRSAYKGMESASVNHDCLTDLQPTYQNELYKAQVDITGHSLSGLLLIKKMPDSSTRVVFSTEMGVKFFDFEFRENGDFFVIDILKKLNKKPVIRALEQDFRLVLMNEGGKIPVETRMNELYFYHGYSKGKKQAWYLTDKNCKQLMGAELTSKRKPLVRVEFIDVAAGNPDSILINHLNFRFNIVLKKLTR